MAVNPRTLEQTELDLETARGELAAGHLDPAVSEDTKMLAAAIAQAGAEIAIARGPPGSSRRIRDAPQAVKAAILIVLIGIAITAIVFVATSGQVVFLPIIFLPFLFWPFRHSRDRGV